MNLHCCVSFLVCSTMIIIVSSLHQHLVSGVDIYVSKNGTSNTTCWKGGKDEPCKTLNLALEGMQNETTVWIESGNYSLGGSTTGGDKVNFKYRWLNNVAIVSLSEDYADGLFVQVKCEPGSGLSFVYSNNVTIRGVEFLGCGMLHNSTSHNFTTDDPSMFANFQTTLHFLFCTDVLLEYINVVNSTGMGAVIYSTTGENLIKNSRFVGNVAHEGFPGGGGLYIEFSYCIPGIDGEVVDCTMASNVPLKYNSNAVFMIESCHFEDNIATLLNPSNHTFILPQNSTHLALGRGGGISVFFKSNSTNNTVLVNNTNVHSNSAIWGAGVFVEYQDNSHGNLFKMMASDLVSNECQSSSSETNGTGGGGARVGYIFFGDTHSHNNDIVFDSVTFDSNQAYYGGGLSFYTAREPTESKPTNRLEFINCTWISNVARVGSAADISVWHPVAYGAIPRPSFTDCSFYNNSASYTSSLGSFVGIGALYIDSVPVDFKSTVCFEYNNESALASVSTGIHFMSGCSAHFRNNTGRNGGAIALMGYSFIEVSDSTELIFSGNSAEIKGGAIFGQSIGEHDLISSRNCFIRYSNISATPYEWNATFTFESNTAGSDTNSIYVTSLLTCLWGGAYGSTGLNATKSVFCWNDEDSDTQERWNYDTDYCSDQIATSPAHFKFNSMSETHQMTAIPGRRESLPFDTYDDQDKKVTSQTVFFASSLSSNFTIDNSSLYISDNQIEIHGKSHTSGILKLETADSRVISTQINVTLLPCPPGMFYDSSSAMCTCRGDFGGLIKCNGTGFSVQLQRGSWIGYYNETERLGYLIGQCPYCSQITDDTYLTLSTDSNLTHELCHKIHRTGRLCGKCEENYGPAVNSKYFECKPCPPSKARYHWIFYLMTEFLPVTIFFFIVVLFNVSATSGPANAFVFFAQVLPTAFKLDGDGTILLQSLVPNPQLWKAFYVIPYDIWNLNFFRPLLPSFCISPSISTLQLLSTGYVTAFYPLLLVVIFYFFVWWYARGDRVITILCRPIHACFARFRRIWNLQRSVLHALATFLLLSYTKFTLVSFILLTSTPLFSDKVKYEHTVVYYDGTISFFHTEHLPYVIVSVLVIITFVALPPIILTLPSIAHYLQKVFKRDINLCCCYRCRPGPNWEQFLNAFHGCYKDGTGGDDENENKHDYRWFAGLYFFLRFIIFLVYAFTPNWFVQYVIQQLVCMCAFLAFTLLRPYKNDFYNKVDATMFTILSAISTLTMYNYFLTQTGTDLSLWAFLMQYFLILFPLIYISVFLLYIFFKNRYQKVLACFHRICHCFGKGNDDENEENVNFLEETEEAGRLRGGDIQDLSDSVAVAVNRNRHIAQENHALKQQRGSNNSGTSGYGATASSGGTQTTILSLNDPSLQESDSSGGGIEKMEVEPVKLHSVKRSQLFHTK